ncbi:MAG: tRNA (adenosine(37)-N6)-threonylcarbamoyltransferase complex ATPase subunit type 1 TsaE [bacterium]
MSASISTSAEQTESLGAELASGLAGGDVVLISGDLGAGKTTFVRGACRALGVEEPVTSPTFTIGRTYRGDEIGISHLDLYRLESLEGRGSSSARRLPRSREDRIHRVASDGTRVRDPSRGGRSADSPNRVA